MKPGKRPTPTSILAMRGSWRAGEREGEPTPPEGAPTAPECLSEKASAKWLELIPILQAMRVLTVADGEALARYCQIWARNQEAEEFLATNSPITLGSQGSPIKHPYVAIASDTARLLSRLEQEFGLTPSARTALKTTGPEKPKEDGKGRFFN